MQTKGRPDIPNGKFCYQFKPFAFGRLSLATAFISEWVSFRNNFPLEMVFHSEWLRNNPKGPPGPIPPKGAEGALGSPRGSLGSHLIPLGPIALVSGNDTVASRVLGGGAGIARACKQGRRERARRPICTQRSFFAAQLTRSAIFSQRSFCSS